MQEHPWSLIDSVGNLNIIFPSIYVGWGSQFTTNVVQKYVGPNTPVEEEQIDEIPTGYLLSAELIRIHLTQVQLSDTQFQINQK